MIKIRNGFVKLIFSVFLVVAQFLFVTCQTYNSDNIYIRTNQIGFLPGELKTAIILSKTDLFGKPFFILKDNSSEIKFTGSITESPSVYGLSLIHI